ncbi:MAG: hypothetical protein ACJ74K_16215 [Actinomycetes bacterium]
MDTSAQRAATTGGDLLRERPRSRSEPGRWTHHVADLNSGEVHTNVLDRPPTSKSRLEGLSRLGSIGDTTIFGGPVYTLTTRVPYLASPEAWVVAYVDYFSPRVGMQWTPGDHPEDLRELRCYFSQLPAERSLLSISLEAAATVGHVSVGWVPLDQGGPVQGVVRFPIQGPDREYTLDFTFDRQGMAPPEFVMTLEPGIDWMLFNSATLQTAPLVTFPGVF